MIMNWNDSIKDFLILKNLETEGLLFESGFDIDVYITKVKSKGVVLIYERNERIFGIAFYYLNNKENLIAFLSMIAVESGHGIGKYLLNCVKEDCKRHGMKYLNLNVHVKNITAIRFYKAQKFIELEKLENMILMSHEL